jgi:hypothetical protein
MARGRSLVLYLTFALSWSCGSDGGSDGSTASGSCAPGATSSCACPNGSTGAQTCNPDGASLGPCLCGTGTGGAPGASGGFGPLPTGGAPSGSGGFVSGTGGLSATGGLPSDTGGASATGGADPGGAGGLGTGGEAAGGMAGMDGSGGAAPIDGCEVTPVPDAIRASFNLDPFYQKYADADGLPIATSSVVTDPAITLACQLVKEMTGFKDGVRQALIDGGMRFTLIATSEELSSLPEIAARYGTSLNQRARGLGSLVPTICAEENILCQRAQDRWRGENICVHEYAHTILDWGVVRADPGFRARVQSAYQAALASGNFANTYAESSVAEFWAEGVQDWYSSNLQSIPANGIHNSVNTRDELRTASPELYQLVSEVFPEDIQFDDCYRVQ